MPHNIDRPGHRANIPNARTERMFERNRQLGAEATRASVQVAPARPGGYNRLHLPESAEKLIVGTRSVIGARLGEVRERTANEPLTKLAAARRAFILQDRRLRRLDKEELTTSELTSEYMAKAILFSPTASEAQVGRNKRQLAEFNDMLMDCATSIAPSAAKAFVPMMQSEIINFNRQVGHSPDIAMDENLRERVVGLSAEIATTRALLTDPDLQVTNPDVTQDLRGIDLTVQREDATVHIDLKRRGKFGYWTEELRDSGRLTPPDYQAAIRTGIAFTGYDHGDDGPKYTVNADLFGEPDGFDYSPRGQAAAISLVHGLLDRHTT